MTKRQQILEAAAELFRTKGYAATSMRDLAKAVHLQASSLYNHIEGKEDILEEICFNNAYRFQEGMQEIESLSASPIQKVEKLIHLHLDIATDDTTAITSFNDEWRHLSAQKLATFRDLRRDYEDQFRHILKAGMANGEIRKMDRSILLYTLLSSLRWVHDWYKPERDISIAELKASLAKMLLDGLRK